MIADFADAGLRRLFHVKQHVAGWAVGCVCAALASAAMGAAPASRPAARTTSCVVTRVAADGSIVLLESRGGAVAPLKGRAWLFEGVRPIARGTVVMTREKAAGAALEWRAADRLVPRVGTTAVALEPDATGRGETHVLSVEGDGKTAWLEGGGEEGRAVGEGLLAEHGGWPVARLELTQIEQKRALARVIPLVGNAALAAGDAARRWPDARERASGRVRSRVLRIVERGPDRELWIPAGLLSAGDAAGDRWEIRREGRYVGLAIATRVTDRFVLAATNAAMCRSAVRAGDEAVRRPAADVLAGRTPMYVFRVDGPYGLVSAGEGDGLRIDMRLTLVRDGRAAARLRVNTVNEDHCGVTIDGEAAPAIAGSAPASGSAPAVVEMRPWDVVYARRPVPTLRVSRVWSEAGVVEVTGGMALSVGQGVWIAAGSGEQGAVVLAADGATAMVTGVDARVPSGVAVGDEVNAD